MPTLSTQSLVALILVAVLTVPSAVRATHQHTWGDSALYEIDKLSLANLPTLQRDSTNRVADDPKAAALGKAIFFDTRFSANGAVSCASCHKPEMQFQDGRRLGLGISEGSFRTMPLAGTSYLPLLFWNGRADSQWSQALGPLENQLEHGGDRTMVARLVATHYRDEYQVVFGSLPDLAHFPKHASPLGNPEAVASWKGLAPEQQHAINLTFANVGKAIAAFERTIPVPSTRFDAFAAALKARDFEKADTILTESEQNGLRLFVSKANCTASCHTGPLLTDMRFHNIGLPGAGAATDGGHSDGTLILRNDPFNCLGKFSDSAPPKSCMESKLIRYDQPQHRGAFKAPSLRGVAQRAPYMHDGRFKTLREVLQHYNNAPKAEIGSSKLIPLGLSDQQLSDIEAFLQTLNIGEKPND
jgi:cytochrome c peroxidase